MSVVIVSYARTPPFARLRLRVGRRDGRAALEHAKERGDEVNRVYVGRVLQAG